MFCFCPIHLNICIIKSSLTLGNKHFLWSVPLFSWYEPHILWTENERTYRVYFTLFAMWHVIWFNLWSKSWKLCVTCMQQLMSLWLNGSLCFVKKMYKWVVLQIFYKRNWRNWFLLVMATSHSKDFEEETKIAKYNIQPYHLTPSLKEYCDFKWMR